MIRVAFLVLLLLPAQEEVRFAAVDVYMNSGDRPLAAYQIEIVGESKNAKIVGVEGGEATAFKAPPYYDPAALKGGRIIIAAFTLTETPPTGRIRVARIHFQETGDVDYVPKLIAAAGPGSDRIEAKIELVRAGGKK